MISFKKLKQRIQFIKVTSAGRKSLRECVKLALEETITLEEITAIGVLFDATLEDLTDYVLEEITNEN